MKCLNKYPQDNSILTFVSIISTMLEKEDNGYMRWSKYSNGTKHRFYEHPIYIEHLTGTIK